MGEVHHTPSGGKKTVKPETGRASGQDKRRALNYWAKGLDRHCNIACNIDGVATKSCKQENLIG